MTLSPTPTLTLALTLTRISTPTFTLNQVRHGGSASSEWLHLLGHEMLYMLRSDTLPPPLKAVPLSLLGPLLARTPPTSLLPQAMPAMIAATKEESPRACRAALAPPPSASAPAATAPSSATPSSSSTSSAAAATTAALEVASWDAGSARFGCALGFGAASMQHFDLVADFLSAALRESSAPEPASVADFLLAQVTRVRTPSPHPFTLTPSPSHLTLTLTPGPHPRPLPSPSRR